MIHVFLRFRRFFSIWQPWAASVLIAFCATAGAQAPASIVLASTTSTEQSGLFSHLLPAFTKATGVAVKVVALGTGQALDMGRRGDADVLLVHDPAAEEEFVKQGFGLKRMPVMYNDFIVAGPKADPAAAAPLPDDAPSPPAARQLAAGHLHHDQYLRQPNIEAPVSPVHRHRSPERLPRATFPVPMFQNQVAVVVGCNDAVLQDSASGMEKFVIRKVQCPWMKPKYGIIFILVI